jgi:ribosome biogenesis GTPase / thiamine phosphate phosphatase
LQQLLEALGWDEFFADAFAPYEPEGLRPARVAAQERGSVVLFTTVGTVQARGHAVTGDWVAFDEERAEIRAVLPRRTQFARKEPWLTEEQVVAANVDTVFLVTDCGRDFKPRRLERYLTAAWDSGADPAIVLAKSDLADALVETVAEAEAVAFGVPVHAVSSPTGAGLGELTPYLAPGRTDALLGSSGVGEIHAREPSGRLGAPRDPRCAAGRPWASHDDPPRARQAAWRRPAPRHARDEGAPALGERDGFGRNVL